MDFIETLKEVQTLLIGSADLEELNRGKPNYLPELVIDNFMGAAIIERLLESAQAKRINVTDFNEITDETLLPALVELAEGLRGKSLNPETATGKQLVDILQEKTNRSIETNRAVFGNSGKAHNVRINKSTTGGLFSRFIRRTLG